MFQEGNIKDLPCCSVGCHDDLTTGSKHGRMDHTSHLSSLREVCQAVPDFLVTVVV